MAIFVKAEAFNLWSGLEKAFNLWCGLEKGFNLWSSLEKGLEAADVSLVLLLLLQTALLPPPHNGEKQFAAPVFKHWRN